MINVTVSVDSDHRYHGISFLGHAGYADDHQEGQELNSLVLGLEDIEETYGEPYIKIRFEEV